MSRTTRELELGPSKVDSYNTTTMTIARTRTIRMLLGAGLMTALLWSPAVGDVELGRRYADPIHGFSLRPPAETERLRQTAQGHLVSWQKRDPQTGAVAWTLSVMEGVDRSERIDMDGYAEVLAEQLRAEDNFKVESKDVKTLSDRPAVDLRGITGGGFRLWQRQVWALAEPHRFLIFVISGPETRKEELNDIHERVMDTLEIVDPEQERERLREALDRGRRGMEDLTPEGLRESVDRVRPRWYMVSVNDEKVGFMWQSVSREQWEETAGYMVRNALMMQLPDDQPRRMWRQKFVSADRSTENWRQRLEVGSGEAGGAIIEEGLRQDDRIVTTVSRGTQQNTHDKAIPAHVREIYLPKALGVLLPHLLDLSEPETYGFASYESSADAFEMRTFTVEGPREATIGGEKVRAIRASDQPAADAEPAVLLLDADGHLLRMTTAEGLVMEVTTAAAVTRRFPEANSIVGRIRD